MGPVRARHLPSARLQQHSTPIYSVFWYALLDHEMVIYQLQAGPLVVPDYMARNQTGTRLSIGRTLAQLYGFKPFSLGQPRER